MKKKSIEQNVYLNINDLEKQEHLTVARLKQFVNLKGHEASSPQPTINILSIMNWVIEEYSSFLQDQENLKKYIHNRIIIDGQFFSYCEESGASITCLQNDSLISWKSDHDYEKFFAQGIYLIKSNNLEFLSCAIWHNGSQNEDEISFFVIVSDKNYEQYIKFRNSFDAWVQERDRGNLNIRVIDGEDLPYTKDNTWEELFLPEDLKKDVRDLVENFLNSKDFYLEKKIPWKRGMLLYGQPGCHAKGTDVLMYDGSYKKIEDVAIGDQLMGPDSYPREVLKLVRGEEKMYRIFPNKGKYFDVNQRHKLYLEKLSNDSSEYPEKMDITVSDFLSLSDSVRSKYNLVKSDILSFSNINDLSIDLYILGLFIGSKNIENADIISSENEIIEYCKVYADKININCYIDSITDSDLKTISFSYIGKGESLFSKSFNDLNIYSNKHIPEKYLTSSIKDRLDLLAGIIDISGRYNKLSEDNLNEESFEIIQNNEKISNQIIFLAGSLGLNYSITKINGSVESTDYIGDLFKINIIGPIWRIPCKSKLKQAAILNKNKNHHRVYIKNIVDIGNQPYYGVTVDKDHKYIMDDFWITNNCGKSSLIKTIISEYNFKPVTIVPGANVDAMREAFSYAEEQSPSLLYFEDLDSLIEAGLDVSSFLNFMDGISTRNGLLVIATANDVKKLKTNITQRPSRFDRKFEIPLPNAEMAYIYMKRWFGNSIDVKKCRELAKYSEKYSFSYAYIKELYISSMFEALAHNRKSPTIKDIDNTLNRLIKEKNILNNGNTINTDKYFK